MYILWIYKVYGFMGRSYFDKNNSIEIFEDLLFLVQYDVLKQGKRSFLRGKIYLYDNKVRIKYLSDLLRVSSFHFFRPKGASLNSLNSYIEIMKKYMKLSDQEIVDKVMNIIKNEKLDEKYFEFKKYDSKPMRYMARISANGSENMYGFIRTYLVSVPTLAMFLALVFVSIYVASVDIELFIKNLPIIAFFIVIEFVMIGIWVIWTWKWMKPTKYEIENRYLND
ncbi:hypothetical protein [Amedibacillus sp. YH-ame10]